MKNEMNVRISIEQEGFPATYAISQISESTFNARLKDYSGEIKPPVFIKFFKSEKGWRSAFENEKLISALGKAVDRDIQSHDQ